MNCVICGSTKFLMGPGKRLSSTGKFPRCQKCGSLERHRAIWKLFERLADNGVTKILKTLQFAPDRSVAPSWFKSYEESVFGGKNSLDLCNIDRPDSSYDLIICNHVLEHVIDDKKAVQELLRITSDKGAVFVTVPVVSNQNETVDWGFPDKSKHKHYRAYGSDIYSRFFSYTDYKGIFVLGLVDPATKVHLDAFLFFQTKNDLVDFITEQ